MHRPTKLEASIEKNIISERIKAQSHHHLQDQLQNPNQIIKEEKKMRSKTFNASCRLHLPSNSSVWVRTRMCLLSNLSACVQTRLLAMARFEVEDLPHLHFERLCAVGFESREIGKVTLIVF